MQVDFRVHFVVAMETLFEQELEEFVPAQVLVNTMFLVKAHRALDAAELEIHCLMQLDFSLHGQRREAVRRVELVEEVFLDICIDDAVDRVDHLLHDDD